MFALLQNDGRKRKREVACLNTTAGAINTSLCSFLETRFSSHVTYQCVHYQMLNTYSQSIEVETF